MTICLLLKKRVSCILVRVNTFVVRKKNKKQPGDIGAAGIVSAEFLMNIFHLACECVRRVRVGSDPPTELGGKFTFLATKCKAAFPSEEHFWVSSIFKQLGIDRWMMINCQASQLWSHSRMLWACPPNHLKPHPAQLSTMNLIPRFGKTDATSSGIFSKPQVVPREVAVGVQPTSNTSPFAPPPSHNDMRALVADNEALQSRHHPSLKPWSAC